MLTERRDGHARRSDCVGRGSSVSPVTRRHGWSWRRRSSRTAIPTAALTEVTVILSGNPGDAPAHRLAADILRRTGRVEESLTHLRQAASLDPSDRESRVLAEVLEGAGKVAGTSGFARLLADDTFATMSFGTVCLEQGLADESGTGVPAHPPKRPGKHPGPGEARRGAAHQDSKTEGVIGRCRYRPQNSKKD